MHLQNEYLRALLESVPCVWTPSGELGEWAHLNELAQENVIQERVETLYDEAGRKIGSRFYYRRPVLGMYYTPRDVYDDVYVYDPEMGSGGFLAVLDNPSYEGEDDGDEQD